MLDIAAKLEVAVMLAYFTVLFTFLPRGMGLEAFAFGCTSAAFTFLVLI